MREKAPDKAGAVLIVYVLYCRISIRKQRIPFHQFIDMGAHFCDHAFIFYIRQDGFNHFSNLQHQVFLGAARSDGRRAQADARSLEGRARVERHHIFVYRNVGRYQRLFCHFACQVGIFRAQVYQHGVVIRAAAHDGKATVHQGLCQGGSILFHFAKSLRKPQPWRQ